MTKKVIATTQKTPASKAPSVPAKKPSPVQATVVNFGVKSPLPVAQQAPRVRTKKPVTKKVIATTQKTPVVKVVSVLAKNVDASAKPSAPKTPVSAKKPVAKKTAPVATKK